MIDKFKQPFLLLAFFLLASTFVFTPFENAEREAHGNYSDVQVTKEWNASNVWLDSADCMLSTGVWLAVCAGEKIFPIAHYSTADDPGHAFLLGMKAYVQNRPQVMVDIATLNIRINLVGLIVVVLLLFSAKFYFAAFSMLAISGFYFSTGIGVSPHSALIGVACFAFILPASVCLLNRGYISKKTGVLFCVLGGGLLGLAMLLRGSIGTMGVVVSVGVIVFDWALIRDKKMHWPSLVLIFYVVLAWNAPSIVLKLRDKVHPVQETIYIQSHGFAHTLLLGLGTEENKFGIEWNDGYGADAARKVNPDVKYTSEEYFDIIEKLYLEYLKEDPLEVARIYIIKAEKVLNHNILDFPVWMILFSWLILLIIGQYFRLWSNDFYKIYPVFTFISVVFIGFFIVQGTLAHPSLGYAYPIAAFLLIMICMTIELLLRIQWNSQVRELKYSD